MCLVDCRGISFTSSLQTTVEKYCEQFAQLNVKIQENRQNLVNQKDSIFHHDNARPHVAQQTS